MPFANKKIRQVFSSQLNQTYTSLLDALPDVTIIINKAGAIIYANAQTLPVLGYPPREMLGWNIELIIPERYRLAHARHVQGYFQQPKPRAMGAGIALYALRYDGVECPVEISLSPFVTEQGTLVICALRDISERQKIQAAFQGDERFRLFLQHAQSAIAMFDREMRYLAVTKRWLEDYHLTHSDIIGISHYTVFPDITQRWRDIHRRCLAGEVIEAKEDIFLRDDGEQDWVNWKMHPWHTADGAIGGTILFTEVVTKHKKTEIELHKSHQRFREIFEHALTGIAITNLAGDFELCNPAFCKLLGFSPEELQHINITSLICPEDRDANQAMISRLIAGEVANFIIENRFFSHTGKLIWIRKFVSWLTDETDKPANILVLVTDVTNQKQHEAELEDSYAFNASILNSLDLHIAVLDEHGVIVAVNKAWRQFAVENGLEAANQGLLGSNYLDACRMAAGQAEKRVAQAAYNGIRAVLTGERENFQMEYPCHSPQQQRWFNMKVSPLAGSQCGAVVSYENISERILAKLKLREKEQMLSESQRLAHIGSWAMDLTTGDLSLSDEAYRIFGLNSETFAHNWAAFMALIHADDHGAIQKWLNDCQQMNSNQELDFRIILADGRQRYIRGNGGVQLNEIQTPVRIAGSLQDISERIHKEQQAQAHLAQLAHVTRQGLMSEMVSGIAHEVNQPLTAISSYLQAGINILDGGRDEQEVLRDILYKTQQQALRAGQIINHMRDFLKSQPRKVICIDMNALIYDAASLCAEEIKQQNINLSFVFSQDLPEVCVDRIQIEQVIINLIRNSIDALKNQLVNQRRNLSIHSQLSATGEEIQIRVKDNGPGITEDQRNKILMPFYTTKETGMGLGLSICRSLLDAHKGQLRFNSLPGKGTTFYFTLPICNDL